jgi:hypothetical protein
VGNDLLQVVKEVKTIGKILHCINVTFIAVIPKMDHPSTFNDFRPISLCNCLYKIIEKNIGTHLNPVLATSITAKQFGFLKG